MVRNIPISVAMCSGAFVPVMVPPSYGNVMPRKAREVAGVATRPTAWDGCVRGVWTNPDGVVVAMTEHAYYNPVAALRAAVRAYDGTIFEPEEGRRP